MNRVKRLCGQQGRGGGLRLPCLRYLSADLPGLVSLDGSCLHLQCFSRHTVRPRWRGLSPPWASEAAASRSAFGHGSPRPSPQLSRVRNRLTPTFFVRCLSRDPRPRPRPRSDQQSYETSPVNMLVTNMFSHSIVTKDVLSLVNLLSTTALQPTAFARQVECVIAAPT